MPEFLNGEREHDGSQEIIAGEHEEGVQSRVILEFMRHGKKETDSSKTNADILLSDEGRAGAHARGTELEPQPEVAVAFGGPKKRTRETSGHVILSGEGEVSPTASLEEMETFIAKHQKAGKKIVEDPRLDFDNSGPIGPAMRQAFLEKRYLPVMVEDSDRMALEHNDRVSSTCLRHAGNVAEIVSRYAKIGGNFNRLVGATDKYEPLGNCLERYLATHQGVAESFLAKVLEKQRGIQERDEFVRSIGAGFNELQGLRLEIVNTGSDQEICIIYGIGDEKKKVTVSPELLAEIIEDRRIFEEKFRKE